ncbi:ABC transporter ATP-binding protein [Actinomyces polynesiensis]|uniref:ABC transporter ATP-binding protein n=1 Tax=Actinomyces polynesiensis TaxID=1325934 RepID=UPI000939DC4F|nr:ABC transporter ATP-binding protein [Actinomyces polynesiensis]
MSTSHARSRRRWWWPWRRRRNSAHAPLPAAPDSTVSARGLTKVYGQGPTAVRALDAVDLDIARGRLTAVMGPSGSGKSTLLHLLAGLDEPTSGTVLVDGHDLTAMDDDALTALRRDSIGFVFQGFNLVPTLTARENITLPAAIAGRTVPDERLASVADTFDLADALGRRASELSGGQQQRVAIARAVATDPAVVFADEPTGNLDSSASREVLSLLRTAVDSMGSTVVMVTHDPWAATWADRVLILVDGRIAADLVSPPQETLAAALRASGHHLPASRLPEGPTRRVIDEFGPPERHPLEPGTWEPGSSATRTRRDRSEDEDTRTQEIALLAVERVRAAEAVAARSAATPDALREELGGDPLQGALDRLSPVPDLPAESAQVVERARRILGDLPGPVVPDRD